MNGNRGPQCVGIPGLGLAAALGALLLLGGCDGSGAPSSSGRPGQAAPGAAATGEGVRFEDRAETLGVNFLHTDGSSGKYFIAETLASGVGLWDFDGDGRLDIYFPSGRMLPPGAPPPKSVARATGSNVLYRQQDDGTFRDVTASAGVPGTGFGIGCCVGDYDADGHLDLYVTQYGPNVLYRNRGDGRFEDVTARAGVGDDRLGAGAAFFDCDGDGDLDLYVSNYCLLDLETDQPCLHNNVKTYCPPESYRAAADVLYRNNGDGTFSDVSEPSRIRQTHGGPGRGLGVFATDFNGDGRLDVFVANDGSENFLFENRGDGTFEEVGLLRGVAVDGNGDAQSGMGADAADFDGDGKLDIIVTNYQRQSNALYRSDRDGFREVALTTGLGSKSLPWVGWGTKFFDYDNDGFLDVFIANGHLEDGIAGYDQSSTYLQRNQLLRNTGTGKGRPGFEDVSAVSGPGLQILRSSRGAAFGDIDNDGDIDIVISNSRDRPDILINQGGNRRHWVGFRLIGRTDPFALNALVTVHSGGRARTQEPRSGASYVSQNDLGLHFGLGAATRVDRVEIRWPDGSRQELRDVPIDRYTVVRQN